MIDTNLNPQSLDPSPTINNESPVVTAADSTTATKLPMSPIEEVGPKEKRNRRAPFWVKDYYTK